MPPSLDVRQTPGIGEHLVSLGWGAGIRTIKRKVWQPLVSNPTVPPAGKEQR